MKTFRLIGMALIAILLSATACSDGGGEDNPVTPPEPEQPKSEIKVDSSITTNGVSFSSGAGEQSVSFTSNEKWTLSIAETRSGTTWVTPSATSGNAGNVTITFKVTENTDYEDRSVAITIKAGTATITFKITQKGVDAMLLTTTTYEVPQEGATIDIEVQANIDYTMEISEAAKEWITEASARSLKTYKHSLKIAANEEYDKREGEIYFKSGDKTETVHVYQTGGAIILLSQNEFTVSDKGETISVELKSNCEYGVQMPDVDWIIDESSRGASSHTLKYTIEANEGYDSRSAQIIYYDKNSELKDTLTIIQAQKDAIILSQKEVTVASDGETIEVKLNTNVDFEIQMPDVDWLSQSKSRALTEHSLKFVVSKNESEEAREAKIVFINKDSGISETLTVKQNGVVTDSVTKEGDLWIVTQSKAGRLMDLLSDAMLDIKSIKITGPLNGDDIKALRQMLGGGEFSSYQKGKLNILDLTDALIVEGGSSYYESRSTKNNEIGDYMFYNCAGLQSIQLPNGVTTIGYGAFRSCEALTSVTIPNSVTTIGEYAFQYCDALTSVTIGNSVTTIEGYAFDDCDALTSVTIGNSVTTIGNGAFRSCEALTSVTIPNSVTTIGEYAFQYCDALTSVTIPNSVTTIGGYAFFSCEALTSVTIGNSVTTIGESAFYNCSSLTSVTIPNSVTTIGEYAFQYCDALTSVTIGNSVTTIGEGAFRYCSSLTSVTIPNSVTTIEGYAFDDCDALTSVTIGNSVTTIGGYAFSGCKLEKVYSYATTPPSIYPSSYDGTFKGISKSATLYVPKGTKTQYTSSDWGKIFGNIVVMEE